MVFACIENTFEGLLTAVFSLYRQRDVADVSAYGCQLALDSRTVEIAADKQKAARISAAAEKALGSAGFRAVRVAYRSGESGRDKVIFDYLTLAFRAGGQSVKNLAHPAVIAFNELHNRVTHETHRLRGFVRFSQAQSGVYFAAISPDHDVLALLLPYFRARFRQSRFVIHDTRRQLLGICDGSRTAVMRADGPVTPELCEQERNIQRLFKQYYKRISIPERKNLRLMRQFMPVRYHRHMPERDELL